jgi:hypothetical protein
MFLWHDSLDYQFGTYLAAQYPGCSPSLLTNRPHETLGKAAIEGNGSFTLPALSYPRPAEAGVETMVIGFLFRPHTVLSGTLLEILTAGGTSTQLRVRGRGLQVQIERGSAEEILAISPTLQASTWVFLELLVRFDLTDGEVILRANGTVITRRSGIRTEMSSANRFWDTVRLDPLGGRMADLYLLDGRGAPSGFLDKHTHSKISMGETIERGWCDNPAPLNKWRLIVMAGQSNETGNITTHSLSPWRNPNPKVQIWDRITIPASPAFRPLDAGVNTSGMFFLPPGDVVWGPEMQLAENICLFYENQLETAAPNIGIIKGTQNGSFLFPFNPDYCWNPAVTNNLWNGYASPRGTLNFDIVTAVATLPGGWASVERVDFFWYQGESDSIFTVATASYRENLEAFFTQVRLDIPAPTTFHIIQVHKDHEWGTGPDSWGLWYIDAIRQIQKDFVAAHSDTRLLNVDHAEIDSYKIHMTEAGYNTIGDVHFQAWLKEQELSDWLLDYGTHPNPDERYIASAGTGIARFSPSSLRGVTNTPSRSVACNLHARSTGTFPIIPIYGTTELPQMNVAASSWQNYRTYLAEVTLPESLKEDYGV